MGSASYLSRSFLQELISAANAGRGGIRRQKKYFETRSFGRWEKRLAAPIFPAMTNPNDVLASFSTRLTALAEAMRARVVAIRLSEDRHLTGTLLQPGLVVASEQSLPRRDEFELLMPGGARTTAKVAGRDP